MNASIPFRPVLRLAPWPLLATGLLACLATATLSTPTQAQASLLVASRFTDEILRYDGASGAFLGVFASGGGLDNPVGLTFGPDGDLYVASGDTSQVLRYDGTSGAFLGVFAEGGGLNGARQVNFGPDGDLYVGSGAGNAVLRYDGTTGAFVGVFASGGNLQGPTSFTFGPDGDLYVGSVNNDRIKRYDGTTGTYLGNFVSTNLDGPHDLAFGPDGALYVSNAFLPRIQRFDGTTGAFLGTFILDGALTFALGLCWDEEGRLLVVNQGGNEVRRYDGVTGAYLDSLVTPGSGGVSAPLFAAFEPRPGLALALSPGLAGVDNLCVVTGAHPGSALLLGLGTRLLLERLPACTPPLGLPGPLLRVPRVADESGRAFVHVPLPASLAGRRVFLRAVEPARCTASGLVPLRL